MSKSIILFLESEDLISTKETISYHGYDIRIQQFERHNSKVWGGSVFKNNKYELGLKGYMDSKDEIVDDFKTQIDNLRLRRKENE